MDVNAILNIAGFILFVLPMSIILWAFAIHVIMAILKD